MGDTEPTDPGERRRANRISSMRSALRTLEWELQRIATLDNLGADVALHDLSVALLLEATRAQMLREEFSKLVTAEFEEMDAACDAAAEREAQP